MPKRKSENGVEHSALRYSRGPSIVSTDDYPLMIRRTAWLIAMFLPTGAIAQVAASETFRLEKVSPAPWGTPLGTDLKVGSELAFNATALEGPQPLNCVDASHVFIRLAPENLFQGLLPTPAEQSAQRLGMPSHLITQRTGCSNAGFDIHRSSDGRAWIGLDNQVLQWRRTRHAATPEARVQSLLIAHFTADFDVSRASVERNAQWLSPSLSNRLQAWFKRTAAGDEPPYLNGDPFTDSQEAPESFELAPPSVNANSAEVTVTYRGADIDPYRVVFLLTRVGNEWRIDDLRFRNGELLSQALLR